MRIHDLDQIDNLVCVADFIIIPSNDLDECIGQSDTGLCIEYHLQAKARLILEFPPLAGRLDDVWYTYKVKSRSGVPGASLYANGGVSQSAYGWVR